MLLGWSYMDYYAHSYAMNQYLASRGFVVLSVNYRLGIGYGRAFQHAPGGGLRGSSEYQDVLAAAQYLQKLPAIDPDRIGIWGGSYGGLLTAQALARNSDIFKAGVDLHGVHDFSLNRRISEPQRYEQGDYAEAMKTAFESSPVAFMDKWRSPVLLIHGDADGNVPFLQTVDLARRLLTQGTPYEELILPNEVHGFLRYESWLKADVATIGFFEDKLKR
jgi:dipeptidyl aminopeptidase/acylaminoacyl peptidase